MTETRSEPPTDGALAAVARGEPEAAALVSRLAGAGIAAVPMDLEQALGAAPVAVVDPGGWEAACRRALSAFEARPSCPPAVLLTGDDPLAIHRVEPAFGFLALGDDPRRVARIVSRACQARERFARYWPAPLGELGSVERSAIGQALESAVGLEIRTDRETAFRQAVRTRMVGRLVPSSREYASVVCREAEEVAALAALLSVGETYFWRYSGQFLALQALLIPALRAAGPTGPLRIWSAGCATGEEAYSLAIAALEALGPEGEVEVVGTDLNSSFLAHARAGIFRERSLRNLPSHLRRRYLETVPRGARASEALRRRTRFEPLNLGGAGLGAWAAANGPFHAIFCRNTLIYFSRGAADRIVDTLGCALAPGGGLFLGASESLFRRRSDLEVCRGMGSFYYRRAGAARALAAADEAPAAPDPAEGEVARCYASGLEALDAEDFGRARRCFGEVLERRPGDARGHAGLAFLLANEGREAEAEEHLARAAQRGPPLPETPYLRGLLAERRGDEVAALGHYREALGVDPMFFMAHINRAWILRRLGRTEGAAEELRAALGILKACPRVAPRLTGGMGHEGLLGLVAEALAGGSRG